MDLSRVVDVSAQGPDGVWFGSGYLVAPGLVLTARHVVCDGNGEALDGVRVRCTDDGTPVPCRVAWPGRADLDAAVLECTGPVLRVEPVRWGQLVASQTGIACEAAGFPQAMEQDGGLRDVEQMSATINPGTGLLGGRIYADVTSAHPQPGEWAGMSGAALWCGPLLVGVVAWDQTAFAARRLAAEPVTRLFADPQFRALLGEHAAVEVVELAGRRPRVSPTAPAFLLHADVETARFRSRAAELAELAAWCAGPGVRVRLLTGAGGQGKTRLARELVTRLAATGQWATAIVPAGAQLPADIRQPLLAVVDYAETRPEQTGEIVLSALSGAGHTPVRLLLLARSAGDWWDRLRTSTCELEMALAGAITTDLAPLDTSPAGRAQAFTEALHDYADALAAMNLPSAAPGSVPVPELAHQRFGSALRLQMTALAALLGGTGDAAPAEEVILHHEARYWRNTAAEHGLHLHDQTLRCAVAAAALCGAADHDEAMALLAHVPGLHGEREDTWLRAARWLRDLYSPPTGPPSTPAERPPYWGALQPDLLAEHLAASIAAALPRFLPGLLETTSDGQDHQALTVLSRAAATRPDLAGSLTELLTQLPGLAPAAVKVVTQAEQPGPLLAALTELAQRHDLPVDILAAIADSIPPQTQTLARFAVAVQQKLVAADERLAGENPDAYLPDLARSLNNLSVRLGEAGRQKEGLAAIQRAVAIREQLAEASPDAYLPDLAMSLNNLSLRLAEAGRREEGLAAIQRARQVYEQLAEVSPDAYLPDLARSLNNLSVDLAEAGRREEALAAIQRAVAIREQLAETHPQIFEPNLAQSLANLGDQIQESGDPVGAVEPLVRAWTVADRCDRDDLADLAVAMLHQAHERQPDAVAAEYERLTTKPWPL